MPLKGWYRFLRAQLPEGGATAPCHQCGASWLWLLCTVVQAVTSQLPAPCAHALTMSACPQVCCSALAHMGSRDCPEQVSCELLHSCFLVPSADASCSAAWPVLLYCCCHPTRCVLCPFAFNLCLHLLFLITLQPPRASKAEHGHLQQQLGCLLSNQRKLVWRRWALEATTKGLEYAGVPTCWQ